MPSEYVCDQCRASIDAKAVVCPHCGYNPAGQIEREAGKRILLGTLLCLTVIGGVIGIPLIVSGYLHGKRAEEASPAIRATPS
jgi:hypothetical protein